MLYVDYNTTMGTLVMGACLFALGFFSALIVMSKIFPFLFKRGE